MHAEAGRSQARTRPSHVAAGQCGTRVQPLSWARHVACSGQSGSERVCGMLEFLYLPDSFPDVHSCMCRCMHVLRTRMRGVQGVHVVWVGSVLQFIKRGP